MQIRNSAPIDWRTGTPTERAYTSDLELAVRRTNPRAADRGIGWQDLFSVDSFIRSFTGEIREGREGDFERNIHGIFGGALPLAFLAGSTMRRDVSAEQLTTGGALVAQDAGTLLAEALRPASVIARLGATFIPGLVGEYPLPRISAGGSASFVTEGEAYAETTPTLGSVVMRPHDCGAYCDLTRHARKQSKPSAEAMIRADLRAAIFSAMDWSALHGSGLAGDPLGIASTEGIGSVSCGGAAPSHTNLVGLLRELAIDDADAARAAYLVSPAMQAKLMVTDGGTAAGAWLWQPPTVAGADGSICGRAAYASGNVADDLGATSNYSAIFCGHWSHLVVGLWGNVEVNVDTSTFSLTGIVRIVMAQAMDIGLRHPAAFAAILDASAS